MNFYALSALFNAIICSFLALLIFFKKDKPVSIKYFNLFNLSVLFWAISYFFWQTSTEYAQALFWVKMLMLGAVFTAPTLFLFASIVAGAKKMKIPAIIALLINASFGILNFTATDYFITDLRTKAGVPFFPTAGEYYWLFLAQWFLWFLFAFYLLYRAIKIAKEEDRGAAKAILYTTIIALVFAGVFNYLPWYDVPIPPVTTGVISIYGITMVLLLLKGRFYRIHLLYFEFFAGIVVLLSVLQFILSQQLSQWAINLTTAIILLLSSFFIIQSGRRERQQLTKIEMLNQSLKAAINQVTENITDGVLIVNRHFNMFEANTAAKTLFGHGADYPKTFADFARTKINQALFIALNNYFIDGQTSQETEMIVPEHHKIHLSFSPFAIEQDKDAALLIIKKIT